jgi:hypothetical protein
MSKEELIPKTILKFFVDNPKIGRRELSRKAGISEPDARFFCKVFKEKQKNIRIKDVGVAAYDIHYPEHDERCINVLLKILKDVQPSIFILGGDQLDLSMISAYNKKKPKLLEGKRIGTTYIHFQKDILDKFEQILPRNCTKYWLNGNHEYRVNRLLEADPKLEGLVEIKDHLNLDDWIFKEYKEVLSLDKMHFTHGLYYNKYHSEKNVRIYQKNLFTGHAHTSQIYTSVSPVDSLPKQGVSVGCLCDRNPEYARDKPNRWVQQILIFWLLSDDTFHYQLLTIINGRTIFNGKLYDGNK